VARFAPPRGFVRVDEAPGSFGAWLRTLPLADRATPVTSYRGDVLHAASAAVAAIDVGSADLQQCADSIIRLHAEWRWASGARGVSYRAASGAQMPWARWARGERPVVKGATLSWEPGAKAASDHGAFRKYLDQVFTYANTGSLSVQGAKVRRSELRPGDFVVEAGSPGHAVLVLDVARAKDGRQVALLGQGYMPAQSFQVLRPAAGQVWFSLDDDTLRTPFWEPFAWSSLRRLDELAPRLRGAALRPPAATMAAPALSPDTIVKLARLARLRIPEADLPRLTVDLTKILGHIEELSGVDTEGVEATAHVSLDRLRAAPDEPGPELDRAEVLGSAPRHDDEGFRVPGFVED
jgi:aspartyl/glutamyl-tRNA(Asn/Gln) amidotransferase C subunit